MKFKQIRWLLSSGPKTVEVPITRDDGCDRYLGYHGKRYYFKLSDAQYRASGPSHPSDGRISRWFHPCIPELDDKFFYYKEGYCLLSGAGSLGKFWWRPLGTEKVKIMSNNFIVKSTLDMLDDPNMRESWKPVSKNSYKFADILVSPTEIRFDGVPLKLSFMQRMRFLKVYGQLQEYYAVKKFRDSIALAQEKGNDLRLEAR